MIQSDTFPKKFKIKKDKIVFVDIELVKQIVKMDDEKEAILYEYDEYMIKLEPRKNMVEYIEANYDKLLKYAKANPYIEKIKMTDEEKIAKLEKEKSKLEQDNIVSMLAITELYEMMLGGQ